MLICRGRLYPVNLGRKDVFALGKGGRLLEWTFRKLLEQVGMTSNPELVFQRVMILGSSFGIFLVCEVSFGRLFSTIIQYYCKQKA